uniref:Uncharacterized protein n=1 Tax=Romanomermis culicivorax TaxID=13658 RepID=A0A915IXK2_ROMCU
MTSRKIDQFRHLVKKCEFCSVLRKIRSVYYVELLILLFNLGQGLRASANFPLFYEKVCSDLYNNEQRHLCKELKKHKQIENTVQGETAKWLMYNEIVTFVPYLLSATFFGSYGDK